MEFVRNGTVQRVKASKEVLLLAGAVGSAKLLLLSGIGPRAQLEKLEVCRDLVYKLLENFFSYFVPRFPLSLICPWARTCKIICGPTHWDTR